MALRAADLAGLGAAAVAAGWATALGCVVAGEAVVAGMTGVAGEAGEAGTWLVAGCEVGLAVGGALQPLSQPRPTALRASKVRDKTVRCGVGCGCGCGCWGASGIDRILSLAYSVFGCDCGIDHRPWRVAV